ncbi:flagellar hook protein FlgE [uncultured Thermanaerothrix sp.]|uniref:flagellar hook protein FlgE n=1 Tax=uncultured Thermanaerothrix sp. TaxID=1195149 RepID=UPI0026160244|nr:flagellar hook protein FlgE [uncultured Thermanaerothrix sp.]
MLRSMFTAISALNANQAFLDVVADNLANANTPGFKASKVLFQDQFSQLLSPGSAPTNELGGINPTQIGLGIKIGYITPVFSQGMLQATGRNSDLALQGDGFFIYRKGGELFYSREASLHIDAQGYLVNSSTGQRIQGWQNPIGSQGPINTNNPIGDLAVPLDLTLAKATSSMIIGGNLSSDLAIGQSYPVTLGVYDSLGQSHSLTVTFTRTGDNTWSWQVSSPTTAQGNGTLTFDTNGNVINTQVLNNIRIPGTNGAADVVITNLDMSQVTMLATESSIAVTSQDGLAAGNVTDVSIEPNSGRIHVLFSNGLKQLIGQLAIAKFTNPSGLIRDGQNLYRAGLNSGEPNIGTAGSGGRGVIASGYLEASNVDMATEFTNLIIAQRGFQASSRLITASDEILAELVNLKR